MTNLIIVIFVVIVVIIAATIVIVKESKRPVLDEVSVPQRAVLVEEAEPFSHRYPEQASTIISSGITQKDVVWGVFWGMWLFSITGSIVYGLLYYMVTH